MNGHHPEGHVGIGCTPKTRLFNHHQKIILWSNNVLCKLSELRGLEGSEIKGARGWCILYVEILLL